MGQKKQKIHKIVKKFGKRSAHITLPNYLVDKEVIVTAPKEVKK